MTYIIPVIIHPSVVFRHLRVVFHRKITSQMNSPCLKTYGGWISIQRPLKYDTILKIAKIFTFIKKSFWSYLQIYNSNGHDQHTIRKLES